MANENMIKFYRGLVDNLPAAGVNGALYITTDEGAIYYGTGTGMKRLGDYIMVDAIENLPADGANATSLYYCVKENVLCRYDSAKGWVQINKQPTADEMKTLLGLGTAAYKNEGDFDAAGSAKAVRDYVGEIPEGYTEETIVAYVNKKAEETLNAASGGSSESAASVLAALNTYKAENDPKVTANTDAIAAIKDGTSVDSFADVETELAKKVDKVEGKSLIADTEITRLAGMSDGANKVEKSDTNGNIKIDGAEVVVYTHPEKHAIADVDGLQDALDGKSDDGHEHVAADITDLDATIKGYDYATKTELGDVDAKFADYKTATEQKAIDDEQDRRLGVIEGDYLKAADIADFETKENVKKVSDELDAYKTSNDTAVALKADKSVVDAMYTNTKIDELVQAVKDYADTNDADTKYGITYDSENKKIKLVEGGTEVEIDATEFIKDGMIETVTIGEDNDLVITFNTAAGKEDIVLPLDQLVDIYTGVEGARVKVTVASDKSINAELVADSITSGYLSPEVRASLAKADTALQEHQSLEDYRKAADQDVIDAAQNTEIAKKLDKTTYETDKATTDAAIKANADAIAALDDTYATDAELTKAIEDEVTRADAKYALVGHNHDDAYDAKGAASAAQTAAETKAAELDAALKTELQGEIDVEVKVVADDLAEYKTSNDAAVALKANAADVYTKTETFTKDEVNAAIAAAVETAHTWGEF